MVLPARNASSHSRKASTFMFSGIMLYFFHIMQKAQARENISNWSEVDNLNSTHDSDLELLLAISQNLQSLEVDLIQSSDVQLPVHTISSGLSHTDIADIMSKHATITSDM